MADPSVLLRERFQAAIVAAYGPERAGVDPAIRRSDRADYQANGALALAKQLGSNPREVTQTIVSHLDVDAICEPPEIAGPGFINLTLLDRFIVEHVRAMATDDRLGVRTAKVADTIVVDYSAPNVAKEMHVGHLRSTIIGDALVRVHKLLGHRVIRQNHLGDWGTPFGMLIEHLSDLGEDKAAAELSVGDLNAFYQQARIKFDSDPVFAERSRARVVALQAGDPRTVRLWQVLVKESARYFAAVYERLGVTLSPADSAGESTYNPMLADLVDELHQKGLLVDSDDAQCVFPPGFVGRDGKPLPLIVQKSDGGYGYAATDLAAIRYRTQQLRATKLMYVVGAPQREHLEMVFTTARLAGWLVPPAQACHVAFGSVLGTDKKMLRTRGGASIRLVDLLDEAIERARAVIAEKNPHLDPATATSVAEAVGIGAVKYADLSNDRIKDYVFDWNRMLSFDGNTAPYLQYAHARICSIFRRGDLDELDTSTLDALDAIELVLTSAPERALALHLLSFDGAVWATAELLQPHRLCTYLFELATTFTSFYEACPVLRAETPTQRHSRLVLCLLTARTLACGLDLLGIVAPDRM